MIFLALRKHIVKLPMSTPHHLFISTFLDYLRFEKRYSEHTVRAYQDDLEQLIAFTTLQFEESDPVKFSAGMIRSWLADMKERKFESRTINRKISTVRSYYKYLLRTGAATQSPMANVTAPKISKRLPGYVEEPDMATL